ncbi:nitrite/sulfite reductase [Aestuariirhabdus litorea]|uniref:Nitrite/sulfite reductase n=1 Tax=Aestuariirhabdus litorea TaxID=2528527 RepID=A0A3P3VTV2_9GAMM|nr:nitrite/sulfite reductase [Aestuariirhabdus litorea]RRJ84879.1 nitrite/sulfite reductase [Aestuariirhabdus litorea]RWW98105.1 nitrite/sulfite reductase [Endozoicomonadaceae bacterium GTF-13]
MYKYDAIDQQIVNDRARQYRGQTERYLNGELSDPEFLPLRLQNGLYVQRFAPMLRIAVPYGMLSSQQLRKLSDISRRFDKGYAHVSTRQNIQLNWPALESVPDILEELASVQMHAIQTSGSCIRSVTSDHFAGVAADELEDPRPWCEIIRQWSTLHPEFAYLPRKFKIAVNGAAEDRAAVGVHDIGLTLVKNSAGETGFQVQVGGGLGRTPIIGSPIRDYLPWQHLLTYLEAILRVYNRYGRRDNKYKARIKILVKALSPETFAEKVEQEWEHLKEGPATLTEAEVERVSAFFTPPAYERNLADNSLQEQLAQAPEFARWHERNVMEHKIAGYAAVTVSLKATAQAPGDISAEQMDSLADLADRYSFGELRTTHMQNMVLADVRQDQLFELWQALAEVELASPNIGTLNDIICCPGGDFCSLANAKSIPVAEAIQRRFSSMERLYDIGDVSLNFSGCMNACGHHHVGNIGLLGVDKKGEEFYQIQLGGSANQDTALAKIIGRAFSREEIPDVIEKLIDLYLEQREPNERFIDTFNRIGIEPFKERAYAKAD